MVRIILISFVTLVSAAIFNSRNIRAKNFDDNKDYIPLPINTETSTNFKELLEEETEEIPIETEFIDDHEMEIGEEKELEKGVFGKRIKNFKVTYWQGKEVSRVLNEVKIIKGINRKVRRGTRIIWRELPTPGEGIIKYWRKITVWATSYDGNCEGCLGRTYSGTPVVVGTCAVDPKIIVMGSHFYVPGYGLCSALDIGGAIKGNKIDLGFPDVSKGWWSARFVEIYLTDGIPKN